MKKTVIHPSVFTAEGSRIIGDVSIGENSSVWFNAVIRADEGSVTIGACTNLQDGIIIHGGEDTPVVIGDYVVAGHGAIIHGCTIGDNTLIGMGAIILSGARIGRNCIIGAGALVTENQVVPDGSLLLGVPATVKRRVTDEEIKSIYDDALHYVKTAKAYKSML